MNYKHRSHPTTDRNRRRCWVLAALLGALLMPSRAAAQDTLPPLDIDLWNVIQPAWNRAFTNSGGWPAKLATGEVPVGVTLEGETLAHCAGAALHHARLACTRKEMKKGVIKAAKISVDLLGKAAFGPTAKKVLKKVLDQLDKEGEPNELEEDVEVENLDALILGPVKVGKKCPGTLNVYLRSEGSDQVFIDFVVQVSACKCRYRWPYAGGPRLEEYTVTLRVECQMELEYKKTLLHPIKGVPVIRPKPIATIKGSVTARISASCCSASDSGTAIPDDEDSAWQGGDDAYFFPGAMDQWVATTVIVQPGETLDISRTGLYDGFASVTVTDEDGETREEPAEGFSLDVGEVARIVGVTGTLLTLVGDGNGETIGAGEPVAPSLHSPTDASWQPQLSSSTQPISLAAPRHLVGDRASLVVESQHPELGLVALELPKVMDAGGRPIFTAPRAPETFLQAGGDMVVYAVDEQASLDLVGSVHPWSMTMSAPGSVTRGQSSDLNIQLSNAPVEGSYLVTYENLRPDVVSSASGEEVYVGIHQANEFPLSFPFLADRAGAAQFRGRVELISQ